MRTLLLLAILASSPAAAEVKSSGPGGFEVQRKTFVLATPQTIFAQIGRVAEWWNPAHSYSGKAANLRLDLRAGGCFCETLAPGSVEHARVVYANPKDGIRLSGALGPLQSEAVTGTLAWSFRSVGNGTEITQTYYVSGQARGGLEAMAGPVDKVLGDQFDRLVAALGKRRAPPA